MSNSCLSWGGPAQEGSRRVRGVGFRGQRGEVSWWRGIDKDTQREKEEEEEVIHTHTHT